MRRYTAIGLLIAGCTPVGPTGLDACAIGVSPTTIDGVVEQLTELPEPSIACFVASLERPLRVAATDSITSTQPASERHPRTFLFLDELVVSTVASGPSADQLEFGERFDNTRSVKGELHFPLPVLPGLADPFAGTHADEGTRCGVCHREEDAHPEHPERFVSRALRPRREQLVDLGVGALEYLACSDDSERCLRLQALYGYGEVEPVEFGVGFDTLF